MIAPGCAVRPDYETRDDESHPISSRSRARDGRDARRADARVERPAEDGVLLKGTLHDAGVTALTKPVDLKVAPTGKSARFTWWCGRQQTVSNRNAITVAIKPDGTFAGTSNVGTLTVWTVKGRFVTATSARASLRIISVCDAKGGLVSLKGS